MSVQSEIPTQREAARPEKVPISMKALLEWAVQVEQVDKIVERRTKVSPADFESSVSADGVYSCAAQARLGIRVDCVGSASKASDRAHPDAEAVYSVLRQRIVMPLASQVLYHARTASEPDWGERLDAGWSAEPVLVWDKTIHAWRPMRRVIGQTLERRGCRLAVQAGRLVVLGGHAHGWRIELYPIRYLDRRSEREGFRDAYHQWWSSVRDLAYVFAAEPEKLRDWRVTAIGAESFPWLRREADESP